MSECVCVRCVMSGSPVCEVCVRCVMSECVVLLCVRCVVSEWVVLLCVRCKGGGLNLLQNCSFNALLLTTF